MFKGLANGFMSVQDSPRPCKCKPWRAVSAPDFKPQVMVLVPDSAFGKRTLGKVCGGMKVLVRSRKGAVLSNNFLHCRLVGDEHDWSMTF